MKTLLAGCAVLSIVALTAARCTPEQQAEVVQDYAARSAEAASRASSASADCAAVHVDLYDLPADAYVTTAGGGEPPARATVTDGRVHGDLDISGNYGDVRWEVTALSADRSTVLFEASDIIFCAAPDSEAPPDSADIPAG